MSYCITCSLVNGSFCSSAAGLSLEADIDITLCTLLGQSSVQETWTDPVWAGDGLPGPCLQEAATWGAGHRGTHTHLFLQSSSVIAELLLLTLQCQTAPLKRILNINHHLCFRLHLVDCADILLQRHDQQALWPRGTWAEGGQTEAAGGADSRGWRDGQGENSRVRVSHQFCLMQTACNSIL